MTLSPDPERLLQGFLEAFGYPEPAARRVLLRLRGADLDQQSADLVAALDSMQPKLAARALRVLADQFDGLADDYARTLEDPS